MTFWPIDCFKEKQILITGGTSGIGAGIAEAFLNDGANVTLTGATDHEVLTAKENLPRATCKQLDVRNAEQINSIISDFDQLDHVINCAGVIKRTEEHDPETFSDVIDINLNGSMRICHAARRKLSQSNGSIVNMASMLSYFGSGVAPAYASSKGAIAQMTKSLAIAYADDGIRVNAIAPGWIKTPLTQSLQDDPEKYENIKNRTALKCWGNPSDIAGGVIYLCSPLANYITGTILPIDGGYLAV